MASYADVLLEYMSTKGAGTWEELKAAHQWIEQHFGLTTPRASRVFSDWRALGYLDLAFDESQRWTVAPPAIVELVAGKEYLLCGARTDDTIAVLRNETTEAGIQIETEGLGDTTPDRMTFTSADPVQLKEITASQGINWSGQFSRILAGCLPSLESLVQAGRQASTVPAPDRHRFLSESGDWILDERGDGPGLYRYEHSWRREYRFCSAEETGWIVPMDVGIYAALSIDHVSVLELDAGSQVITLPVWARPPAIFEKALVLCSGRPGVRSGQALRYGDVPKAVADQLIRVLQQRPEEEL